MGDVRRRPSTLMFTAPSGTSDTFSRETMLGNAVLRHQVVQDVLFAREPVLRRRDDQIEHTAPRPGATEKHEPGAAAAALFDPAAHRFVL